MGKLSVGLWCGAFKSMYWIKGPSEFCKKLYPVSLTKDQYARYCTLPKDNKSADSFEMMGEGDKLLAEKLEFTMGDEECTTEQ